MAGCPAALWDVRARPFVLSPTYRLCFAPKSPVISEKPVIPEEEMALTILGVSLEIKEKELSLANTPPDHNPVAGPVGAVLPG